MKQPSDNFDILIVGAGPVGSVVARLFAENHDARVLILERRSHLAGNCYDPIHPSGLRIHQYGPHYFRTNDDNLYKYLSRFTEWIPGNYIVKSSIGGKLFPFPINLDTLESFFKKTFATADEAETFLRSKQIHFPEPKNSEEYVLSRVGQELYEAFYLGYTKKQWGIHPKDLDASVCGRIPIRLNRENSYVDHKYQITPKNGFESLFKNMLAHPKIELRLNVDFNTYRANTPLPKLTLYTGPLDEYFENRFGKLPWRSLKFDWQLQKKPFAQPCVQINYPNEHPYTRSVEIKHVTQQLHPHTMLSLETPCSDGEPYYPIPGPISQKLFLEYQKLSLLETKDKNVFFAGRLATYRYINTDEAILTGMEMYKQMALRRNSSGG